MDALKRLAEVLEDINDRVGRALAWLVVALTLMVVYDVSMRYLFRAGSPALQELEWHLFALMFLLGAAATYQHNGHVRVEIFYQRFSERTRLWLDLLGDLLFLLPTALIIISASWPFVEAAFLYKEASPDPGGLPHRFLIKAAIPAGFSLLALQAIANIIRKSFALMASKAML